MAAFLKRLPLRVKLTASAVIVIAAILCLYLFRGGAASPALALEKTGIRLPEPSPAQLYAGEVWKPAAGADGFALALENGSFAFYVDPVSTRIAVVDKRTGYRWSSNPGKEQLASETVKGLLLSNLKSPFVLTYVRTKGKDQTIREMLNALDPKIRIAMTKSAAGLQIAYSFPEKKLGFAIQYELTSKGLKARIPTAGIQEEGEFAVFSIDLLPYFGAASAGEDGYVFVPDGPGGLIRFESKRVNVSRGYIHQVYGFEVTNARNWSRSGERREGIPYPVFGMKRGDNAFMAVLTEGGDSANVTAMPPGLKSSLYNVFANQIFREEYLYRMTRLATPVKAVQKPRLNVDREVEYRFLNGENAGYVGMAKAYRDYLTEKGQLKSTLKPVEHAPLYVKIMGGNYMDAYGGVRYVAATTFPQAAEIVDGLRKQGARNLKVVYFGWENMGDYDMYKRFPIEPALGGESAARAFMSKMKREGVEVQFSADFVWIDSDHSDLPGKTNAIRGIDGTAFIDEGWFISKPARTVAMAYDAIRKLKAIGVNGIQYNWLGEMIFNDYEPSGIVTRSQNIGVYQGLFDYTRKELGSASVWRGNDYTIGRTDFIDDLPHESSYDFMVDETVPFYPIVLHGYVPYSFGDGNLRSDVEAEFLKAIEYGAVPQFFLTYEETRKLRYSYSNFLYSSQYAKWSGRILEEYKQFDSLSGLFSQRIKNHEKLSAERFATTYEDGTRVIVDYAKKTFSVEKGGGA